ncbi:hypothetical protein Q9L58_010067 [Maublancomyces gigas]|uniref:Uncharacterized protein n=1 Tax=Discina gigas TaxID=1032678 RepID=A0ABR3G5B1_9PEZI
MTTYRSNLPASPTQINSDILEIKADETLRRELGNLQRTLDACLCLRECLACFNNRAPRQGGSKLTEITYKILQTGIFAQSRGEFAGFIHRVTE